MQIVDLITHCILTVGDWFLVVLVESGTLGLWTSALFMSLVFKFLVFPVFGRAKSDLASKSYNSFKRRKDS